VRRLVRYGIVAGSTLVAALVVTPWLVRVAHTHPYFVVHEVAVRHRGQLDAETIRRLAGVEPGTNVWKVDAETAETRLLTNGWIRSAELRRELPDRVVLHVREAHGDLAAILGGHRRCRGVVHSFTGTPAEAEAYLELGWHLAFNGILTYRRQGPLADAARLCPRPRLLVETDSPYLAPVPHRGRRCEPALVVHTLGHLASLRGEEEALLARETTENARRLFF
jgi:TatD DNase family protein